MQGRFLKTFKQKRLVMVSGKWWFHLDNAPLHTATVVINWTMARQFQVFQHLPYPPDLAPADFFLLSRVKRELAGYTLTQKTFKKEWEGPMRNLLAADFATAFQQ
jgi:hypothetical protein